VAASATQLGPPVREPGQVDELAPAVPDPGDPVQASARVFGRVVGQSRQGYAIAAVMALLAVGSIMLPFFGGHLP
jgi:hypothetical protein